ncbi:MAG: hypothetical protein U0V02_16455 [Anaerolineales bacterium]
MSQLIALQSAYDEMLTDAWFSDFSNLKQKSLLFDQVGIFRLSKLSKQIEEVSIPSEKIDPKITSRAGIIISELEWLKESGIIFEATFEDIFDYQRVTIPAERQKEVQNLFRKIPELQKTLANEENIDRKVPLVHQQFSAIIRLMAIVMEITKGVTTVTTDPIKNYDWEFPNSSKSNVMQVVIKNLPLPSNETPWEQIIDYRSDPENKRNLINLRSWIRKISVENPSQTEIAEQLEWLMNEFQTRMKIHKMKANTETVEIIIKAPLELIENTLKIKLSKIPEPFFALKKRQISLMEAELNTPGREMAYIIKAKDTFQSEK